MEKIKSFSEFLAEAQIPLSNPEAAGDLLTDILAKNRNAQEEPSGSNKGPQVNKYLGSVGLREGLPWCMAFVYYVFDEFSKKLGSANPLPKTGGVKYHWDKAPADLKITADQVRRDIKLLRPGQIFMMSRAGGKGLGHTGIVINVDPAKKTFTTIEGNTSDQKSGEGDRVGVNVRKITDKNIFGFIDYFKTTRTPAFEDDLIKSAGGIGGQLGSIPNTPVPDSSSLPSDSVVGFSSEPAKGFASSIISGITSALRGKDINLSNDELAKVLSDLK